MLFFIWFLAFPPGIWSHVALIDFQAMKESSQILEFEESSCLAPNSQFPKFAIVNGNFSFRISLGPRRVVAIPFSVQAPGSRTIDFYSLRLTKENFSLMVEMPIWLVHNAGFDHLTCKADDINNGIVIFRKVIGENVNSTIINLSWRNLTARVSSDNFKLIWNALDFSLSDLCLKHELVLENFDGNANEFEQFTLEIPENNANEMSFMIDFEDKEDTSNSETSPTGYLSQSCGANCLPFFHFGRSYRKRDQCQVRCRPKDRSTRHLPCEGDKNIYNNDTLDFRCSYNVDGNNLGARADIVKIRMSQENYKVNITLNCELPFDQRNFLSDLVIKLYRSTLETESHLLLSSEETENFMVWNSVEQTLQLFVVLDTAEEAAQTKFSFIASSSTNGFVDNLFSTVILWQVEIFDFGETSATNGETVIIYEQFLASATSTDLGMMCFVGNEWSKMIDGKFQSYSQQLLSDDLGLDNEPSLEHEIFVSGMSVSNDFASILSFNNLYPINNLFNGLYKCEHVINGTGSRHFFLVQIVRVPECHMELEDPKVEFKRFSSSILILDNSKQVKTTGASLICSIDGWVNEIAFYLKKSGEIVAESGQIETSGYSFTSWQFTLNALPSTIYNFEVKTKPDVSMADVLGRQNQLGVDFGPKTDYCNVLIKSAFGIQSKYLFPFDEDIYLNVLPNVPFEITYICQVHSHTAVIAPCINKWSHCDFIFSVSYSPDSNRSNAEYIYTSFGDPNFQSVNELTINPFEIEFDVSQSGPLFNATLTFFHTVFDKPLNLSGAYQAHLNRVSLISIKGSESVDIAKIPMVFLNVKSFESGNKSFFYVVLIFN